MTERSGPCADIDRLERRCAVWVTFPRAATSRGDKRLLGFERRVGIAYMGLADQLVGRRVL